MRVDLIGLSTFVEVIKDQAKAMDKAVDNAVVATANEIRNEAVKSINKQSRGEKTVKRGKKKHYISPEGGAPNTDGGTLVRSIQVTHLKGSQEAIVFSPLEYAAYLEFVLDRPWLEPATEGKEDLLRENILQFAKKALR
tara:strand:- start:4817 stop:5233 length:417 start_codon:yes stop_codon:yes gene_type:complete